jgi:hypothetical protein
MQDLEELEIKLAKALDRIASITNKLPKSNIPTDIARSNRLEQHILMLTDQLEAQETGKYPSPKGYNRAPRI